MDVRQAIFPYGMQKQSDGTWVFFNRGYKPVGMNTRDHVAYSEHPVAMKLKDITSARRARLSYTGEDTGDRIMFYNDSCNPTASRAHMDSYLEKLALLMALKVEG